MNRTPYMLAYPGGDRSRFGVFYVREHQERDWDLASERRFETAEDARDYGDTLLEGTGIDAIWKSGILD